MTISYRIHCVSQGKIRLQKHTSNDNTCAEIRFQMRISDLSASIQPQNSFLPQKTGRKSVIFQRNDQFDRDKCMSKQRNRRFWIRKTVILRFSSNFNLHASFAKSSNFQVWKTCWKSPGLSRRIWVHFGKMSLARWFWAFYWKSTFGE